MKEKIEYDFAKKFSKMPGPRYKHLGEFSGEEFRENVLKKLLEDYKEVQIDGSGITTSFNPSFLSEAFGVLAEKMGEKEFFKRVRLFSNTNPGLEEKFREYSTLKGK